jgi:hypothetical protein
MKSLEFDIDFESMNDSQLIQTGRELERSYGHYRAMGEFSTLENPLNTFCGDFYEGKVCPRCPLEKITEKKERKSLCFYMGHDMQSKEATKVFPNLIKRVERIIRDRGLFKEE